ncbi:hypothetical protein [Ferrimicrobium acidiphilum]|uniref:hypothetical protein n=1 Tax=Ferrimicrobium acidiphilum TaxID=121039 RepID=UPI0023EFB08E|nr:hypothetical protein [Ferrimicrobium acidiphilum]
MIAFEKGRSGGLYEGRALSLIGDIQTTSIRKHRVGSFVREIVWMPAMSVGYSSSSVRGMA